MKVGYVLMLGEVEERGAPRPWRELRAMALQAEAAGFDSVWVYDHLLYRFPDRPTAGIWEGWTLLAALAEATERVELGTIVMCTAWRNPALLAKMAVTADEVSGGRIILGLGAGWHQPEFHAFGYPFDHLGSRFEEALAVIHPLLKEGRVDFQGRFVSANDCELRPRGPRPGLPPILIAARGPKMLETTARYADQWNAAWFGRPTLFRQRHADLVAACERVGRDPATIELTAGVSVAFPQVDPAGMPENLADADRHLQGTPEELAAAFREYEALGVSHLLCISSPESPEGLAALSEALAAYRRG